MRALKPRVVFPEQIAEVVAIDSPPSTLCEACSSKRCHVQVAQHTITNCEKRHGNEDRWMYRHDVYPPSELSFHTVGILDGHDSEKASDRVAKDLPEVVSRLLKEGYTFTDAYTEAMIICEERLRQHHVMTAGTCVASCTIAGNHVWCANLGDCRAILFALEVPKDLDALLEDGGFLLRPQISRLQWMSLDQKVTDPAEAERIAKTGYVTVDDRVEGLEPSRTLGDFDVKAQVGPDVISIIPEVRRMEVGNGTCPAQAILVLGTDGVWDAVNGQDMASLIACRKEVTRLQATVLRGDATPDCSALRDIAEDIVQFAVARGSADDSTAVVALISVS